MGENGHLPNDRFAPKHLAPRYRVMGADLPPETVHSEKLLALATDWRERANRTTDPYHSDLMRRAAEELERAAVRAVSQAPARP